MLVKIAYTVLLLSAYYGITAYMGAAFMDDFWTFMFADYIAVYDTHIATRWPGWTHPVVLILTAAMLAMILPGVLALGNLVAIITVALFITRVAFLLLSADGAPTPTIELAIYALMAFGWLFFSSAIGDRSLWNWFRDRRLGVR
ncbi:MAG: hypothetical protein AAF317_08670 [Pseudomonadota bacterium]